MGSSTRNLPRLQRSRAAKLKLSATEDFDILIPYMKKYYELSIDIIVFLVHKISSFGLFSYFVILWYRFLFEARKWDLKFIYSVIVSSFYFKLIA